MKDWSNKLKKVKTKDDARQLAIDFQHWSSDQSLSYGELYYYLDDLHIIGKKFGLIKEFKENGIL